MAFFDQEFGVWLLATELTTDNLEAKVYSRSDISEITAALFLRRSAFGPAVFWI
jgi:hypothetical protein